MKFHTRQSLPWMVLTGLVILGTGSIYAYDNALSTSERSAVIRGVHTVAGAGQSSAAVVARVFASLRKGGHR